MASRQIFGSGFEGQAKSVAVWLIWKTLSTGETRETSGLKGTNEHVHFGPRASPVTYPWLTPRRRVLSCAVVPDTPTKFWRDATSCSVNKMRFRRSGSSSARPNARRHWRGGPFHFRLETLRKITPRKIMSVEAVPKNSIVQALLGTTRMRTTCQDMVFPTLEFVFEFRHHVSQFLRSRYTPASMRSKGDRAWRPDSRGQCVKIEACFRCGMHDMHEATWGPKYVQILQRCTGGFQERLGQICHGNVRQGLKIQIWSDVPVGAATRQPEKWPWPSRKLSEGNFRNPLWPMSFATLVLGQVWWPVPGGHRPPAPVCHLHGVRGAPTRRSRLGGWLCFWMCVTDVLACCCLNWGHAMKALHVVIFLAPADTLPGEWRKALWDAGLWVDQAVPG